MHEGVDGNSYTRLYLLKHVVPEVLHHQMVALGLLGAIMRVEHCNMNFFAST